MKFLQIFIALIFLILIAEAKNSGKETLVRLVLCNIKSCRKCAKAIFQPQGFEGYTLNRCRLIVRLDNCCTTVTNFKLWLQYLIFRQIIFPLKFVSKKNTFWRKKEILTKKKSFSICYHNFAKISTCSANNSIKFKI